MGIFGPADDESMDPQDLLARGHADMAESMGEPSTMVDPMLGRPGSPFRLTVADVFMIRGRGTVLTGVVESGTVRVGSIVAVEREGQVIARASITGIEKFRRTVDEAGPGENVGLLVTDLDRSSVQSGDTITG